MKLSELIALTHRALETSGDMDVLMEVPGDEFKVQDAKMINCQHEAQKPYFFITAEGCEE